MYTNSSIIPYPYADSYAFGHIPFATAPTLNPQLPEFPRTSFLPAFPTPEQPILGRMATIPASPTLFDILLVESNKNLFFIFTVEMMRRIHNTPFFITLNWGVSKGIFLGNLVPNIFSELFVYSALELKKVLPIIKSFTIASAFLYASLKTATVDSITSLGASVQKRYLNPETKDLNEAFGCLLLLSTLQLACLAFSKGFVKTGIKSIIKDKIHREHLGNYLGALVSATLFYCIQKAMSA